MPTPVPSSAVYSIGSSLVVNFGLFAILPVAVGAMVFFVALKGFGDSNDGDPCETVLPALFSAVVVVVMTEICVYIAVYVVSAFN